MRADTAFISKYSRIDPTQKKTALYYYFSRHRSVDATQQNLHIALLLFTTPRT